MCKIIAVTNQKGGVGKTTTISAMSGILSNVYKKRVLAIDLDPQGNLSFSLGAEDDGYTIHDVLVGNIDIEDAVQRTKNGDIIPSNILLSGLELELTAVGREYILKDKLKRILKFYDYVLLDTPPALSILTINAYTAADDLIIPMTPEILSLQGLAQLKETILAVKKFYNQNLNIRGILLTKYNAKSLLTKEVEEMVKVIADQLGTVILDSKIALSIAAAEAPAHKQTLISYSPRSKATKDYLKLIELLYKEDENE